MSASPRSLVRAWAPAAAYMLLIWLASSSSHPPSASWLPYRDKGAHFLEYALLSALLAHAFRGSFQPLRARLGALFASAALCAVCWGLIDEIHQAFVPGRSSDVNDLIADALGALVGAGIYTFVTYQRQKRSASSVERA